MSARGSGTGSIGLRNAGVGTQIGCRAAGTAGTPSSSAMRCPGIPGACTTTSAPSRATSTMSRNTRSIIGAARRTTSTASRLPRRPR